MGSSFRALRLYAEKTLALDTSLALCWNGSSRRRYVESSKALILLVEFRLQAWEQLSTSAAVTGTL